MENHIGYYVIVTVYLKIIVITNLWWWLSSLDLDEKAILEHYHWNSWQCFCEYTKQASIALSNSIRYTLHSTDRRVCDHQDWQHGCTLLGLPDSCSGLLKYSFHHTRQTQVLPRYLPRHCCQTTWCSLPCDWTDPRSVEWVPLLHAWFLSKLRYFPLFPHA